MTSAFKREKRYLEYFDDDSFDNIIMTTFEYDRGFIEDILLSHLTGREKVKDINDRIELEDALKSKNITVIASAISNEPKTLYGYDLIPYSGVQHSKIVVLSKPDLVRFIIGSVNLTEDAFCKNREAFIVLGYMQGCEYPESLATSILDYLSLISGGKGRVEKQVTEIKSRLSLMELPSSWGRGSPSIEFIAQSNTSKKTIYAQLIDLLGNEKINSVKVMSPFFEDKDGTFLSSFVEFIKKKKAESFDIYFPSLTDVSTGETKWQIPAHSSVKEALSRYGDMIGFYPVSTTGEDGRPLHAKLLFINTNKANYLMVGSSNFTKRGYGFKNVTPNAEANLLIRVPNPNEKTLRSFIPSDIKPQKIEFIFPKEPEQKESDLMGSIPLIVKNAEYKDNSLMIELTDNASDLQESWEIWLRDHLILSSDTYKNEQPFVLEITAVKMATADLSLKVKFSEGEYLYPIFFHETKEIIKNIVKLEINADTLYLYWMSKILRPTSFSTMEDAEDKVNTIGASVKLHETTELLMNRIKKLVKALNGIKRFLAKDTIKDSTVMLKNRIDGLFGVDRIFDIIKGIEDDGTNIFCYSEMIAVMEGLKESYNNKNCSAIIREYIDSLKDKRNQFNASKEWQKYLKLMGETDADTQ